MILILINLLIIGFIIIYLFNRMVDNSYYCDKKEKKIVNFQAAKKKKSREKASEAEKAPADNSYLCTGLGKKCRREK